MEGGDNILTAVIEMIMLLLVDVSPFCQWMWFGCFQSISHRSVHVQVTNAKKRRECLMSSLCNRLVFRVPDQRNSWLPSIGTSDKV